MFSSTIFACILKSKVDTDSRGGCAAYDVMFILSSENVVVAVLPSVSHDFALVCTRNDISIPLT